MTPQLTPEVTQIFNPYALSVFIGTMGHIRGSIFMSCLTEKLGRATRGPTFDEFFYVPFFFHHPSLPFIFITS